MSKVSITNMTISTSPTDELVLTVAQAQDLLSLFLEFITPHMPYQNKLTIDTEARPLFVNYQSNNWNIVDNITTTTGQGKH